MNFDRCGECGIDHPEGQRHRVSFAQQQKRDKRQSALRLATLRSNDVLGYRLRNWTHQQRGRGIPANAATVEYAAVLLRDPCSYCGQFTDAPSIDHIDTRSRGGQTTVENLTASCSSCNNRKGAAPLLQGFARIMHHLVSEGAIQ